MALAARARACEAASPSRRAAAKLRASVASSHARGDGCGGGADLLPCLADEGEPELGVAAAEFDRGQAAEHVPGEQVLPGLAGAADRHPVVGPCAADVVHVSVQPGREPAASLAAAALGSARRVPAGPAATARHEPGRRANVPGRARRPCAGRSRRTRRVPGPRRACRLVPALQLTAVGRVPGAGADGGQTVRPCTRTDRRSAPPAHPSANP